MKKRLFVELSNEELTTLNYLKRKSNDYRAFRAVIVIMSSDGDTVPTIAKKLKKNHHTVRSIIKNYVKYGFTGLSKRKIPGRKRTKINPVIKFLKTTLDKKPSEFGYVHQCWNKKLLLVHYEKETRNKISESTMYRALKEAGYSYTRPRKSVSVSAPSKEEKLKSIEKTVEAIKKFAGGEKVNILFIDESNFSTEPYLIKGWHKKGERFSPQVT